ncbi:hypothetical protein PoB_000219500 [Plakobranchus ocellatus]|uniref:Uncharacterized protein n=1 Tax=Plakobranchus ocellatus TaxID=259542 RepID=A0AAV3XYI0_9GAST|nr:hypothetical protein PoB_000219500 [Plakobranchus ocellatus]
MISGLQTLHQGRTMVVEFKLVTEGPPTDLQNDSLFTVPQTSGTIMGLAFCCRRIWFSFWCIEMSFSGWFFGLRLYGVVRTRGAGGGVRADDLNASANLRQVRYCGVCCEVNRFYSHAHSAPHSASLRL